VPARTSRVAARERASLSGMPERDGPRLEPRLRREARLILKVGGKSRPRAETVHRRQPRSETRVGVRTSERNDNRGSRRADAKRDSIASGGLRHMTREGLETRARVVGGSGNPCDRRGASSLDEEGAKVGTGEADEGRTVFRPHQHCSGHRGTSAARRTARRATRLLTGCGQEREAQAVALIGDASRSCTARLEMLTSELPACKADET